MNTAAALAIVLSAASGVPFYRQIEDQLAELIRAGRLASGTALPSVRGLAAQLKVSVITTRRAYTELEHAGLVEGRRGQGTFVTGSAAEAASDRAHEIGLELFTVAATKSLGLGIEPDALHAILDRLTSRKPGADDE